MAAGAVLTSAAGGLAWGPLLPDKSSSETKRCAIKEFFPSFACSYVPERPTDLPEFEASVAPAEAHMHRNSLIDRFFVRSGTSGHSGVALIRYPIFVSNAPLSGPGHL
jgi:hypothetical protein